MEIETLLVEGMKNDECKTAIEADLSDLAGVSAAEADWGAGTVEVTYDPALVTREQMVNVIEAAGFIVIA